MQRLIPLELLVIAELFGCPPEDRDLLKTWSDHIANFLGNKTTAESAVDARTSILEANDYFGDPVESQRKNPKENLLQNLIQFQKINQEFTAEHLVANSIALIFAGHETTSNLIANSLYNLLCNPEHITECVNDSYIEKCIEESLRFDSPVQRIGRFSTDDIKVDGHVIPKGHRILLMIGAANRDASVFSVPDKYCPQRTPNKHIAFGYGHHLCAGTNIARLETSIA